MGIGAPLGVHVGDRCHALAVCRLTANAQKLAEEEGDQLPACCC